MYEIAKFRLKCLFLLKKIPVEYAPNFYTQVALIQFDPDHKKFDPIRSESESLSDEKWTDPIRTKNFAIRFNSTRQIFDSTHA